MAIGESVPMLDSVARVTGALAYLVNLKLPGMLVGKIVRSQMPHARLVKVDIRLAKDVPGVVAILTGADLLPGARYGVGIKDQPILAQERVRFVGEPVAAIAAESLEAAEEAALLIDVEYEELPAVYSELDAMGSEAPLLHQDIPGNVFQHAKLRYNDIEAAFAEADEIFEDTFTSPVAQHASLEPHVAAARWDRGYLQVWSTTQAPYAVRRVLAEALDLPPENVRVVSAPLGGGYGGKGHVRIEPVVAALACKTKGRPVKIVLSRSEEFVTVTKHAATIRMKSGVRRDGTFTGRQVTLFWNGGAYADASALLVSSGMLRGVGPYRFPAAHLDSYGVYTNLPPAAAFRGAMSSQTTWAYESQMDIIARKMGWDPLEFRLKNLLREGDQFITGETMHEVHFAECLQAAADGLESKNLSSAGDYPHAPRQSDWVRRGVGYAVMMKSTMGTSKSQCRISIDEQGLVTLFTSTVEMGQGSHTALSQITAHALGVPLSAVRVQGPDTATTPFDSTTSASRSTSMMGNAVVKAADALKKKLIDLAAPILEFPQEALEVENGSILATETGEAISFGEAIRRNQLLTLEASGEYATNFKIDPETGQGISTPHWHQGAGAAEVEVDLETGKVRLTRYFASSYAGRVVNPQLAKLQNDGNVIYGLGPALLEEVIFDGGQATNPNFSDYMIPSIQDIPLVLESVSIETEAGEIHGIGEMTLPPVAPAIANAIEAAVGVRLKGLPLTAEKVLRALRENGK